MASNSLRPGDLRLVEGSPPSRCFTTSVVRLSPVTLLTPATYCPSHFTRNLKFLYGSKRFVLTVNSAIRSSLAGGLSGHLLDLNYDKLGRLQRSKPHDNIHDAEIDIGLRCG